MDSTIIISHSLGHTVSVTHRGTTEHGIGLLVEQHTTRVFTRVPTTGSWDALLMVHAQQPRVLTHYAVSVLAYHRAQAAEQALIIQAEQAAAHNPATTGGVLTRLSVARKTSSIHRQSLTAAQGALTTALETAHTIISGTPLIFSMGVLSAGETARVRYLIGRHPNACLEYFTTSEHADNDGGEVLMRTTPPDGTEGLVCLHGYPVHISSNNGDGVVTRLPGEHHTSTLTLEGNTHTEIDPAGLFTQWATTTPVGVHATREWFTTRHATYMLETTLNILNALNGTPTSERTYTGDPVLIRHLHERYEQLKTQQETIQEEFTDYVASNPVLLTPLELEHATTPRNRGAQPSPNTTVGDPEPVTTLLEAVNPWARLKHALGLQ